MRVTEVACRHACVCVRARACEQLRPLRGGPHGTTTLSACPEAGSGPMAGVCLFCAETIYLVVSKGHVAFACLPGEDASLVLLLS